MILRRLTLPLLIILLGCSFASAQGNKPGLKSIAVAGVKVNPAVAAAGNAKLNSLERMAQGMDGQLIDRLQNTRKFEVIARSDADSLMEEAGAAGETFGFGESDYLLVVTIDDFQDISETVKFASLGKTAKRRTVRFSAVGKIYDAADGKLLESANFQLSKVIAAETLGAVQSDGEISDELLIQITREISERIAKRVADVIYPARVLAKTGKIVTINRGDGSDIAVGEIWEVFAMGDELIDPDTGVSLGSEEVPVGMVRVRRVSPKFSQAVITEDYGIDKGAVVRPGVESE